MLQGYFLARDHFYICEDTFGPMQTALTHCVRNRLSHTIYWRSPISIFYYTQLWDLHIPREKWLNYLQTVETLIRRILRCLIWFCTIYQLPSYGSPNYNGLISAYRIIRFCKIQVYLSLISLYNFLRLSRSLYLFVCVEVLRPSQSCWARSVYLTTHLLGRLSPLSG